ncbi:MAG: hypothetical protein CXT69_04790 [Methanobacteriota archaeon]|nr:MAG: hypothetical protein CXT69_04790 [Euryarchaeota archaeon]
MCVGKLLIYRQDNYPLMVSIASEEMVADKATYSPVQSARGFVKVGLLLLLEKPIGIGLWIGLIVGAFNGYMFGLPMIWSISSGAFLGMLVCIFSCPDMRTMLKERRNRMRQSRMHNVAKSKAMSAFTSLE